MAKELPYFKFYCSEWTDGDITLEDLKTQGLFINICAYYWSRECELSYENLQKRFKNFKKQLQNLEKAKILKTDGEKVFISFLDKQKVERDKIKLRNQKNGKAGGRPKKTDWVSKNNPVETNIEEKRREDNKKKNISEKKEGGEEVLLPTSINPLETLKPKNTTVSKFMELYEKIKPFNRQKNFGQIQNAIYQARQQATDDKILQSVIDYEYFCKFTGKETQYRKAPWGFLEDNQMNVDWLLEIDRFIQTKKIQYPPELQKRFSERDEKFFTVDGKFQNLEWSDIK